MDALQHQELLEAGIDAELKQQAKLALSLAAGVEFFLIQHQNRRRYHSVKVNGHVPDLSPV